MKTNKPLNFVVYSLQAALIIICCLSQTVTVYGQKNRIWATYYGGEVNEQNGKIATDASGNIYICGYTYSSSGIASGGFQNTFGGGVDAFLVKFDSTGNRLWATYYGGFGTDIGYSVATDKSGNVYLAGYTASPGGIASGGFKNFLSGGVDAFLVKFNSAGSRLWATYYGGIDDEQVGENGCVVTNAAGDVYLQGFTASLSGISTVGSYQPTHGGAAQDAFIVKFDSSGNRKWATYYGGGGDDWAYCIFSDASTDIYIAGRTASTSGIASSGFQNTHGGGVFDAFIAKFDSAGNRLWGTYYGGAEYDEGRAVTCDAAGNVYSSGYTLSTSGISSGGYQNTYGGGSDAFIVKFDAGGNRKWATYFGGPAVDYSNSIITDASGIVYVAGDTYSYSGIDASGGFQSNLVGTENEFLASFDANGNFFCSTYYGQGPIVNDEDGRVHVDDFGAIYLLGNTAATSGIASGGFQNTYGGGPTDLYLVKFSSCATIVPPVADFGSSDTILCANDCISFTDLSSNATAWQWSFPGGSPGSSSIQHPQNICYLTSGNYDAILIASNGGVSDTLTVTNYIRVFAAPPTPTITKSNDTLFCSTDPSYTSYQWYDDNVLIPGATDTFLVITHSGNYNVSVKNENDCSVAVGINVILKVESPSTRGLQFSISPNPMGKELRIKNEEQRIKAVDIYNALGEKVYHSEIKTPKSEIVIDVSSFAKGTYIIQLRDGEKILFRAKAIRE